MANRDVNLIIRAKNQASKNLDTVSDALKVLRDAQDGVATSAFKTDGAIGNLGVELDKLKAKATAFESLDKAKAIMGAAADAVSRLKAELEGTASRLDTFAADSQKATARLSELESASAQLAARQKAEKAELDAARQATLRKSEAVKELAAAEKAYQKAQSLAADAPNRDKQIGDAAARLNAAKAAVEQNVTAYKRLQDQVGQTAAEMKKITDEIKTVKSSQRTFAADIEKTTGALADQKANLDLAQAEYAQIETSVREAATSLGAFETAQADASATTGKLIPQIERLGSVMQALMRYSTGAGQFVDPKSAAQMRALREQADAAKASWQALSEQARELAADMRAAGGGTDAQKQSLYELVAAAKAADGEFSQLTAEIVRLSGSARAASPALQKLTQDTRATAAAQKALEKELGVSVAAMNRLSNATTRGIFAGFNRESRQAMSVFQRIRGEVLSLATAYVGLYGVISNVGGVISAYQKMEAAQNRLGVVFQQNQSKTGAELTWLQSQAARLGIEFGTLADQYSKFAVSAQAANFSTEQTRRVFLSVAEAGRVNKLSLEDMNGVFLALTQMIQKGRVSSEELRQQLGERLPGAVNIFADAMGLSTAELTKMLEAGEVLANSDTMLKFADELTRRFGPQLGAALQSTSTQIGKFWKNIFQAQLQVANGGFIDSFNRMLADLNQWFQSRDGRDFFLSLGAAAGKLTDALRFVLANSGLFVKALQILIGIKVGTWLVGIIANFQEFNARALAAAASTQALGVAQTTLSGRVAALAASFAVARTNVIAFTLSMSTSGTTVGVFSRILAAAGASLLTFNIRAAAAKAGSIALAFGLGVVRAGVTALRVALLALGGPIGALITLASIFAVPLLTGWVSEVDGATAAADEHLRIMQEVVQAYQNATDKTKDWKKEIKNVSLDEVEAAIIKLRDANDSLIRSLSVENATPLTGLVAAFQEGSQVTTQFAVDDLNKSLKSGKIDVVNYVAQLEKLYAELDGNNTASRNFVAEQLKIGRQILDNNKKAGELSVVAVELGSSLDGVADSAADSGKSIDDMGGSADNATDSFDAGTKSIDAYAESMGKLAEKIPALAEEMRKLRDLASIEADFQAAISAIDGRFRGAGQLYADAVARRDAAIDAVNNSYDEKAISGSLVDRIIGVESGGNALAKNPNSSATGLGQFIESTWLRMFKQYFPDAASSLTDAAILELRKDADVSRKMVELYLRENADSLKKAGLEINDANLYLAHFLGPGGAKALLSAAPGAMANDVLGAGQINANAAILDGKTREEVIAWAQKKVGLGKTELETAEAVLSALTRQREEEQRQTEELQKQKEATDKSLQDLGFENEMLQKKLEGKDKEAFIEEQIRALKEQNKGLTVAQEEEARKLLSRQFDINAALEQQGKKATALEETEKRINSLEAQRNALIQQRAIYEEQGNTSKVQETDAAIAGVNKQLLDAIDNAKQMYAALGGAESDAAIAQLDATALGIQNAAMSGKKMAYTLSEVQDNIYNMLDSGIVSMFQAFTQAIAQGDNAIQALGQAFRQFAAEFLMEIAKMILRQAMFNMLQSISKSLGGALFGLFHSGGIIGTSTGSGQRAVSPAWFNGAMRYHSGGIAGLKPNEVPAILQAGEEVLTKHDPRHARNIGKGGGAQGNIRIVNAFDPASYLSEALKNVIGEDAILNYVRANPSAFKQALEG